MPCPSWIQGYGIFFSYGTRCYSDEKLKKEESPLSPTSSNRRMKAQVGNGRRGSARAARCWRQHYGYG